MSYSQLRGCEFGTHQNAVMLCSWECNCHLAESNAILLAGFMTD